MINPIGDLSRFSDSRVLVVDDNPSNTVLLSKVLSRAGLNHVIISNDSREVPDLLIQGNIDLVLLDLHMPHIDGYGVLELINRHSGAGFLPVLVLTADTTSDAWRRALGMGAQDFVTKPFDAAEVVLRVRNLLRTRMAYLELRRHNSKLSARLDQLDLSFDAGLDSPEVRKSRIEGMLASGGPAIVFQPVINLGDGETAGYEALARFNHEPVREPVLWFTEAESVGLGVDLEAQTARTALSFLSQVPSEQFLAINVSPALALAGLQVRLGTEIAWERIVIELTEHIQIESYDIIQRALKPLREAGARISIDDAGAGFASLRHILNLAPDFIKLDISLCQNIDSDPAKRALVTALVSFAQDTNSMVIAEGIETTEEHETIRDLGAHYGQGYLFARPAPLP